MPSRGVGSGPIKRTLVGRSSALTFGVFVQHVLAFEDFSQQLMNCGLLCVQQSALQMVDDKEPANIWFSHDCALMSQEVEAYSSESICSLWSVES